MCTKNTAGTCQDINTARGKAECYIYLKTYLRSTVFFVHTSSDGYIVF